MPPKRGRKAEEAAAAASAASSAAPLVRPSTPNDFRIVATVKDLQRLVDTESKWKSRLKEAQRLSSVASRKMERLRAMAQHCRSAVAALEAQLEELIAALATPQGADGRALAAAIAVGPGGKGSQQQQGGTGAGGAAQPPGGGGGGGGKKGGGPSGSTNGGGSAEGAGPYPADVQPRKTQQAAAMGALLRAYYRARRTSRDRRPRRPATALEMESSFVDALRLSSPTPEAAVALAPTLLTAEGVAMLSQPASSAPTAAASADAPSPSGAAARRGKPGRSSRTDGASAASPDRAATSLSLTALEAQLGPSGDPAEDAGCGIAPLPLPRGVDAALFDFVLQLRARRLRLEAAAELLERELRPQQQRLDGIGAMATVGNYSVEAVAPLIGAAVEEEAALQRIRAQEDEQFSRRQDAKKGAGGGGAK